MQFEISKLSDKLDGKILDKINNKTKPPGSLGELEALAFQICKIQQNLNPSLDPQIFVFASDHGIAEENVSPFPQAVTYQMVYNFLNNGAAINVFANGENIDLNVIDLGVKHKFPDHKKLIKNKIRESSHNFLNEAAIKNEELIAINNFTKELIQDSIIAGKNCFIFGEMGIANTSAASMIMHKITGFDLNNSVGRGTGLDDEGLQHKIRILERAGERINHVMTPLDILKEYGGYEIAGIVFSMLHAACHKSIILVDGFIATAALLVAHAISESVLDYCIFCHQSEENGHKFMLEYLNKKALLNLNMRLGEGTGAALAYPIIKSAVAFINEMASFDDANVSKSE